MRGVPGWQLTRCIVPTLLRGAESIRMIYRARAGTFFCIFSILGEGFSGFENYVVGLQNDFAIFFLFCAHQILKFKTNSPAGSSEYYYTSPARKQNCLSRCKYVFTWLSFLDAIRNSQ